jgi:hypothetical protein
MQIDWSALANGSSTVRCRRHLSQRRTIAFVVRGPFPRTISEPSRHHPIDLIIHGADFSVPGQWQPRTIVQYCHDVSLGENLISATGIRVDQKPVGLLSIE